jgi:biopolymer transport protein ExbD
MKLLNNKITITLMLLAVICTTGCSTVTKSSTPKTVTIKMTHTGKCQVENKILPIACINKAIKSAGGKKDSRIAIIVPKDMGYSSVKELLTTLAESGYMKVHLQNPREAVSYVNDKQKKEK